MYSLHFCLRNVGCRVFSLMDYLMVVLIAGFETRHENDARVHGGIILKHIQSHVW